MTAGLCPSCLKNWTSLEKHYSKDYFCNPIYKKKSDPTAGLGKDDDDDSNHGFPAAAPDDEDNRRDEAPSATARRSKRARTSTTFLPSLNQRSSTASISRPSTAAPPRFSYRLDDYIYEYQHTPKNSSLSATFRRLQQEQGQEEEDQDEDDEVSEFDTGETTWQFEHNLPNNDESADTLPRQADDMSLFGGASHTAVAGPPNVAAPPSLPLQPPALSQRLGTDIVFPIEVQDSLGFVSSNTDRSMAELYRISDRSGAPRGLVDELIASMCKQHKIRQFSPFDPSITKRDAFFQRLSRHAGYRPAEKILATLESGQRVTVHRFDYIEDLKEKFVSHVYDDFRNNVHCDPVKPFSNAPPPTKPNQPHLLDYLWYRDTYEQVFLPSLGEGDEGRFHLFVPTFYTDATSRQLRSIEPVAMVDSRLAESAKADVTNWVLLGYMPHLEKMSSAMRKTFSSRGSAEDIMARDYHRCMSILLAPFIQFSTSSPVIKVRRGSILRSLRFQTHVAMWSLDNKAADLCCARMSSNGPGSKRITRRCLCPFEDAAASHHVCIPVEGRAIEELSQAALGPTYGLYSVGGGGAPEIDDPGVRRILNARYGRNMEDIVTENNSVLSLPSIPLSVNAETWLDFVQEKGGNTRRRRRLIVRCRQLRQVLATRVLKQVLGTKVVDNPFSRLSYGSNRNGIHAATTADILHVIKNGMFPKFTAAIYFPMTPSQLSMIDLFVERIFCRGHNRGTERANLPRVSFKKGYTKLTELKGSERVGQLYVLAFLLRTARGRELLSPRLEPEFDAKRKRLSHQLRKRGTTRPTRPSRYYSSSEDSSGEDVDDQQGDHDQADELYEEEELDGGTDNDEINETRGTDNDEINETHDDLQSWTIKKCLHYLRLGVVDDLRANGRLPPVCAAKLEEVISAFLTVNVKRHIRKASEEIGELPDSSKLEYRPCSTYLRTMMTPPRTEATAFPCD